jgi:hypothetical protein
MAWKERPVVTGLLKRVLGTTITNQQVLIRVVPRDHDHVMIMVGYLLMPSWGMVLIIVNNIISCKSRNNYAITLAIDHAINGRLHHANFASHSY